MAQEKDISNTETSTYSFLGFNGTLFAPKIMLHLGPTRHGAELHPYPVLTVTIKKNHRYGQDSKSAYPKHS